MYIPLFSKVESKRKPEMPKWLNYFKALYSSDSSKFHPQILNNLLIIMTLAVLAGYNNIVLFMCIYDMLLK
jgi:hypothetical protein